MTRAAMHHTNEAVEMASSSGFGHGIDTAAF